MRLARSLLAIALLAASTAAWGQSTLLQGTAVTPGHVPAYLSSGSGQAIVGDSGPAGGGGQGLGLSELLQVNRGATGTGPLGAHSCFYDNPTTNPAGYHYFCLDANAQGGGLLAYGAGGAASGLPLTFNVNGVAYQFPFSTSGIVGPTTSVIGDAACWNNTVGTLLADCGAFVTVGGNNTWTGTNNFLGPFQSNSVTQTFPGSGNIVGTSDVQTLTNKHINASEIDSGTFPATVMPGLTGAVTSPAGSINTTLSPGVVANSNFAAAGAANTVKGAATSTAVTDLALPSCSGASNALQWTTGTGFGCGTLGATTAGWGLALSGGGVFSVATAQPPYGYDAPINLGLTASVGSSALTINVVGANGSAPSATNPVSVPFRSTTLATGTPNWTAITGALSIVIPSSATLGTSNSVPFRIWIFLAYNGGTPELGVAICSIATQIFPCTAWETNRVTSTTITGFATAAGTLYATTGVANDSVRIIGYAEYANGLATAGAWASVPTTLQLFGPGVKKPGEYIQMAFNTTSSPLGIAGGAGTQILAQSVTPTSKVNLFEVTGTLGVNGSSSTASLYLTKATTTVIAGSVFPVNVAASFNVPVTLEGLDMPSSATAVTYSIYGVTSGGSNTANGTQTIKIKEIQGALPVPANDDGTQDQRMTG